jgi:hypothetical protein
MQALRNRHARPALDCDPPFAGIRVRRRVNACRKDCFEWKGVGAEPARRLPIPADPRPITSSIRREAASPPTITRRPRIWGRRSDLTDLDFASTESARGPLRAEADRPASATRTIGGHPIGDARDIHVSRVQPNALAWAGWEMTAVPGCIDCTIYRRCVCR